MTGAAVSGNLSSMLRMLIVVRDDLTAPQVAVACAHASLAAWFKWGVKTNWLKWADSSFVKVIRRASAAQFEQAKKEAEHIVLTESTLEGRETCLVFDIEEEYPKFLNYLPRYGAVNL